MHYTQRWGLLAGLCLLVMALPGPVGAAGIEAGIEVTECQAPLDKDSTCQLRAFWSGGSGRLQELSFLEAVKQGASPSSKDFRITLRATATELQAPGPDGIRRTRKTIEFGSWLFEGKKPWTYCVKARVKDDVGAQADSQPVCLSGKP